MGPTSKNTVNNPSPLDEAKELLAELQKEVDYTPLPMPHAEAAACVKRIPFITSLLQKVDDTGQAVFRIGERVSDLPDMPGTESIGNFFHFGALGFAIFNFVRIPAIYLSAFLLGKEVPFTLDNNAKFIYSALLLSLAIIALTVPAAAVGIAFVIAGVSLTTGVFLLGKTLYGRYQLGKERRLNLRELNQAQKEMKHIQNQAGELLRSLNTQGNEEEKWECLLQVELLREEYNSKKSEIMQLKENQSLIQEKINELGIMHVTDRSIGIILASTTIAALTISLFFPPVALWMMAGIAVVGGTYVLSRIAVPVVMSLSSSIFNKIKTALAAEPVNDSTQEKLLATESTESTESTETISNLLKANPPTSPTRLVSANIVQSNGDGKNQTIVLTPDGTEEDDESDGDGDDESDGDGDGDAQRPK